MNTKNIIMLFMLIYAYPLFSSGAPSQEKKITSMSSENDIPEIPLLAKARTQEILHACKKDLERCNTKQYKAYFDQYWESMKRISKSPCHDEKTSTEAFLNSFYNDELGFHPSGNFDPHRRVNFAQALVLRAEKEELLQKLEQSKQREQTLLERLKQLEEFAKQAAR